MPAIWPHDAPPASEPTTVWFARHALLGYLTPSGEFDARTPTEAATWASEEEARDWVRRIMFTSIQEADGAARRRALEAVAADHESLVIESQPGLAYYQKARWNPYGRPYARVLTLGDFPGVD